MQAAGLTHPSSQLLGQGSNQQLNVQADLNKLSPAAQKAETLKVEEAIGQADRHHGGRTSRTASRPSARPGARPITNKAIEALIIFFIVVGIYISIRFEPKMALAAFIAMVHDVLVAVGIYSIFNFQVTPDTVVAILTILGYSLYDTVVVFDRVRDNTKDIGVERAHDLHPADQPVDEPDAGPLHQHLGRGHHPGAGRAVGRRGAARRLHPAGVRPGALRRPA